MHQAGGVRRRDGTDSEGSGLLANLSLAQGLYYLGTGLWPLVSMRTFERVTGPKTDRWLVKTAGILIGVIGGVLTVAGARGRTPPEVPLLAAGSAAGLASIDTVYAAGGRISRVYFLDALAEAALVVGWTLAWRRAPCGPRCSGAGRRSSPS